jgi:hypothetical protein
MVQLMNFITHRNLIDSLEASEVAEHASGHIEPVLLQPGARPCGEVLLS